MNAIDTKTKSEPVNQENTLGEIKSFVSKLSKTGKQLLLNFLGYELFKQKLNSPIKICNPNNASETVGYFVSYAVWHQLSNLEATSETTTPTSVDLSTFKGVPYDEAVAPIDLNTLDLD